MLARRIAGVLRYAVRIRFVIALAVIAVMLAAMSVEHRSATVLPNPIGRFPVGRTLLYWTSDAANRPASTAESGRELAVWI